LQRNTGFKGYRPQQAQQKTETRRFQAAKQVRFTPAVKQRVEFYLQQDWSPEQISGYLKLRENIHISHETIYQHVWADKRAGGTLYRHLRWSKKKKRKRYGSKDRRGQIPNRVSIEERPAVVAQKTRLGDWELDTIIGTNHHGALVSAVERKSHLTCLKRVAYKKADLVTAAITQKLGAFKDKVHTLTVDNGKEFAFHQQMAAELDAAVYFAHPYRSWERGLNENTNGLIRQYFPKNYDFRLITEQDISFVENRLNNRPRKSLNFQTPTEIFFNSSVALGT
ncbi:MAG: IS30 family transposase, partial [bacterium]|nr:IS30 family transposase [bacterium]